jgi:hypothetical protein
MAEINPYQLELTYTSEEFIELVKQRIAEAQALAAYWQQVLEDYVDQQGLT